MPKRNIPNGLPQVVNTEVWLERNRWRWECLTCGRGARDGHSTFFGARDAAVIHQKVQHTN